MIIFANRAAVHLVDPMQIPKARYTIKQFSDGEIYIKIEQNVKNETVWIVAGTQSPAENLIELFLLLNALTNAGAQNINLFFSYFGYARQSRALQGEASSAHLIADILKKFPLNKIMIMHAHEAQTLRTFLPFTNVIDIDFFCTIAKNYDALAAPDQGSLGFVQHIAKQCSKPIISLKKTRPEHEQVTIEFMDGIVAHKKILLVDDIISTGRTIIHAAQALKDLGATEVAAAATHGIFSPGAYERLAKSDLSSMYVTNTIKQNQPAPIEVFNVSKFIEYMVSNS